jgi:hypothetical protein
LLPFLKQESLLLDSIRSVNTAEINLLKICFGTSTNISVKPIIIIIKLDMSSIPTDLDSLKRLIALRISEWETGITDKIQM